MPNRARASQQIRPASRRPRAARPRCEALEGRALLAYYSAFDPTFGARGKVVGAPDAGAGTELSVGSAVAVQADGKVVEVGTYGNPPPGSQGYGQLAVRRYNADGTLDAAFAGDGQAEVALPAGSIGVARAPRQVAVQADGSIVLAASAALAGSSPGAAITQGFATRLTAAGVPDASFAAGGQYVFVGTSTGATSVAVQADGRVLVLGVDNGGGASQLVLTRLTAAGEPDPAFNGTGRLAIAGRPAPAVAGATAAYDAGAMVVAPGGQVYIAGNDIVATPGLPSYSQASTLSRVNSDGALDAAYGAGGTVQVGLANQRGLALQPDGRLITVGSTERTYEGRQYIDEFIGRYAADGTRDASFAANTNRHYGSTLNDVFNAVAVGADGSITAAGGSGTVVRLRGDGTPDPGFGRRGVLEVGLPAPGPSQRDTTELAISGLALDPAGRILFAGGATTGAGAATGASRSNLLGRLLPVAVTMLVGDYDRDGISDVAAYLPNVAVHAHRPSSGGADVLQSFGAAGTGASILAPGDYDGDGRTDLAAYLPGLGYLFYRRSRFRESSDGPIFIDIGPLDAATAILVSGDYEGTGYTVPAAYLPASGSYTINSPRVGGALKILFGTPGVGASIPAPGDYDGDGTTDLAVYLPRYAVLAYRPSSGGPDVLTSFGMPGDRRSIPAPGDYDGDGRTDLAVYMPSIAVYAYRPSSAGNTTSDVLQSFGVVGDGATIPAPGDYDGDGRYDIAGYVPRYALYAYRPSSGPGGPDVLTSFGHVGAGATIPATSIPYAQPATVSGMALAASRGDSAGVPMALTDDVLAMLSGTAGRKKKA